MKKKTTCIVLAVLLSFILAMTVSASAMDTLKDIFQNIADTANELSSKSSGEPGSEAVAEPGVESAVQPESPAEKPGGESSGESGNESAGESGGESAGQPGGESAGQPGGPGGESAGQPGGPGGQANVIEEPESSGIPKDEPVSTTGTAYGYTGTFNIDTASSEQVNLNEGEWEINDAQYIFWGGTAIQNAGTSSLAVHNSYIRGETAVETAPLTGPPGGLLVAGNIRTTLAVGNSENIYINSSIVSRNWAALSTDAAQPAPEGGKELSLYTYGSEAITMDGGYGGYSDLFCNLNAYGSHIQSAEIGIISGTYGTVTIGNIQDGENDPAVAAVLTQADRDNRSDKQLPSIIEGGRNALMIHSVNLPPYWEYEGYSQEQIPLYKTPVRVHGSTLRTDLKLDKNVKYDPQQQAYINHTRGSVILVKSTNADLYLEDCEIIPDPAGTGYLIQTVYNNDTMFMNAVPDGETYPGVTVELINSDVSGGIAHEDYQRDFLLTMSGSSLTGYMNEYDCAHWNEAATAEGFTDYSIDASYAAHHGLAATLQNGSTWTVTQESHLSRLTFTDDSKVIGLIFVDGVEQQHEAGRVYEGDVVVKPGVPEDNTTAQPGTSQQPGTILQPATTAQPETSPKPAPSAQPETSPKPEPETSPKPETPTTPESTTEHVHNWVSNGGSPADCTHDGVHVWICTTCNEEYNEILPALGHDWTWSSELSEPATCTTDGTDFYSCMRCGEYYTQTIPATGHDWVWDLDNSVWPTCEADGYYAYFCNNPGCTATYTEPWPTTGHAWEVDSYTAPTCTTDGLEVDVCPACGETRTIPMAAYGHSWTYYAGDYDDVYHYYTCTECGAVYEEIHDFSDPCWCGHTGPVG